MDPMHMFIPPNPSVAPSTAQSPSLDPSTQPFGVPGTPLRAWQKSRSLTRLSTITVAELLPISGRVVVLAPHPDDEVLACGGLLAALAHLPRPLIEVTIIAVTDGEGSHPGSALWPQHLLGPQRRLESRNAMHSLGYQADRLHWHYLGLPDGEVGRHVEALSKRLNTIVRTGDCLVTTWRGDGHGDHEATGAAAAACAREVGARLIELPVWAWHWAAPEDERIPWARARKLVLDEDHLAAKRRAIAAHVSQLHSDPSTLAGPILSEATLARLMQPYELLFL